MSIEILLLWIAVCIATGMFAHIRRNRSGIAWGLAAFFISPVLAIIFLAILKPLPAASKSQWEPVR